MLCDLSRTATIMHGKRILLLSISSSAKTLSWVREKNDKVDHCSTKTKTLSWVREKHNMVDHSSAIPELLRSIRVGPVDFAFTFTIHFHFRYSRAGEKHQGWSCRLRRLPWRDLWPLSWLQHHLLLGDHLLDSCSPG